VVCELDAIINRGSEQPPWSADGTELTSNASAKWADDTEVGWHCFAPGKPQ
jgi:hypothetical protein